MTSSLPQRKSLRLRRYNYAQPEVYFVTVCSRHRACVFGSIAAAQMRLNAMGSIVENCWRTLPMQHSQVGLDEFVIMPNHIHGTVVPGVQDEPGAMNRVPTALGEVVRAFKARCMRHCTNVILNNIGSSAPWQRNYHEHGIRNEEDLGRVREYIKSNPAQWTMDNNNPDFRSTIVEDVATPQV